MKEKHCTSDSVKRLAVKSVLSQILEEPRLKVANGPAILFPAQII